jgi:hypothetical protein
MALIKSPKDFWAALIYISLGAAALYLGADLRMGSAGRMGPGYFPRAIAWLLVGIGVIALIRAVIVRGDPVAGIHIKSTALILGGCTLFAWLLPRAGLGVALAALCLVSAAASREFRFDAKATLGLVALIVACAAVFVKGLGVPLPLWGVWLEPYVAGLPAWMR